VPFESLAAVSYSPFVVTMAVSEAVCEIFSVKKWRDLENQVRGHLRSLKMAPFNRPYATFYNYHIVGVKQVDASVSKHVCGGWTCRSPPSMSDNQQRHPGPLLPATHGVYFSPSTKEEQAKATSKTGAFHTYPPHAV